MTVVRMAGLLGASGVFLYIRKRLKIIRLPLNIPVFGRISTSHEIRNIFDNFGTGQLRNGTIERQLQKKEAPCIIDCGINVGVTARWWFHLNKNAMVLGIDMLKEAQDFTVEALRSINANTNRYRPIVAALWSESGKEFKIGVSDPLYGDYGFYRKDKEETERTVVTKTLDRIADSEKVGSIDLLKIDIEGAAADALNGAAALLKRTRYVVFEVHDVHNRKERFLASKILSDKGFVLMAHTGRHLWWKNAALLK